MLEAFAYVSSHDLQTLRKIQHVYLTNLDEKRIP